MSNLDSWENDPSAQEEDLSRQTQQINLNRNPQQGGGAPSFRPGVNSFTPGAQSFQPGQAYQQNYGQNTGYEQPQYQTHQNQAYGGYPQYGQQQQYNQYQQGGYGGYNQGGYNQQYGMSCLVRSICHSVSDGYLPFNTTWLLN